MTDTPPSLVTDVLGANMALLDARLAYAAERAREALAAMRRGDRNQAIGTLLPLERDLRVAASLLDAIFALHRAPETFSINGGASCR